MFAQIAFRLSSSTSKKKEYPSKITKREVAESAKIQQGVEKARAKGCDRQTRQ